MKTCTETNSDEKFALGLLNDHLTDSGAQDFRCRLSPRDPPDLVVEWASGQQWGVEVTRAYQRVEPIGEITEGETTEEARPPQTSISSKEVQERLWKMAERLEKATDEIRQCGYTLYLEVPGPLSSWEGHVSKREWRKWKKETETRIYEHVSSGKKCELEFEGGALRPSEHGTRWISMIADPAIEIASSTDAMLWHVLQDKTERLPYWNGSFDQRWLLILNCNLLVVDATEVENRIRKIVREKMDGAIFSGIFWSGYPDRTLMRVSLP